VTPKLSASALTPIGEFGDQLWPCLECAESTPEGELGLRLATGILHALCVAPSIGTVELLPQYQPAGLPYRLDYLMVAGEKRIAFECDGLAYHGSQEAFARDRKRDRDLADAGIETYRFTAAEISASPVMVQRQAYEVIMRACGKQP